MSGSGCQAPPEELTFSTWTPIVALPLVDTRFDLGDVLELVGDSLDTTPVQGLPSGELAFVHEESLSGTLAQEWLVLPGMDVAESFVLDENLDLRIQQMINEACRPTSACKTSRGDEAQV